MICNCNDDVYCYHSCNSSLISAVAGHDNHILFTSIRQLE